MRAPIDKILIRYSFKSLSIQSMNNIIKLKIIIPIQMQNIESNNFIKRKINLRIEKNSLDVNYCYSVGFGPYWIQSNCHQLIESPVHVKTLQIFYILCIWSAGDG